MQGGRFKGAAALICSLMLCSTKAGAEEHCFLSSAGFPGEEFVAEVSYARGGDDRLSMDVTLLDIEGEFSAHLELYYGVSASFMGTVAEVYDNDSVLQTRVGGGQGEPGAWSAELQVAEDFPHLAFVLTLFAREGRQPACPQRYVALVLKGSAPPNQDSGELARFRSVDAH